MEATGSTTKLVAMADLYDDRLQRAHTVLYDKFQERIDVPSERQFIGFDAFKQAIDSLRPGSGDIALLTGYAGFRPRQLEYAVERGVNVFMEKSFATDPVGVRRVIAAAEAAEKKGVKIAAGLMCRHSPNREELIRRLRAGELGDLQYTRAYRMRALREDSDRSLRTRANWSGSCATSQSSTGSAAAFGRRWTSIRSTNSAGCTMRCPVTAQGVCGRAANSTDCSQNLDAFNVEWTFPNGTRAMHTVRYIAKTQSHSPPMCMAAKRPRSSPAAHTPPMWRSTRTRTPRARTSK